MSRSSGVRRQFGMNEIVITGSTGVIGRRAARELLAAGHRVTGVTRSARGRERLGAAHARGHGELGPDRRMTAAERFAQARPRLLRLDSELGDVGEAEDVVQDAWLRLERADSMECRARRAVLAPQRGSSLRRRPGNLCCRCE
jgi:nucleoside-diphosphate-sugar epimerase